jgi:hypothetical protein
VSDHAPDCNCHACQPYDDWTLTSEPATSLHIGPCDGCKRLEAERDRLAELEDGYLADIATLNARIKRLVEALEVMEARVVEYQKDDRHRDGLAHLARSIRAALAFMEGDK